MATVKISLLPEVVHMPAYQTDGAAGMDLRSRDQATIWPGGRCLLMTGIRLEIPPGYEAQIRSRSGLALENGVVVLNAPGTIDSDYRGEIGVILFNSSGAYEFLVRPGDRIAQMVFAKVERVEFVVGELTDTKRGGKGFGSTGK